MLHFMSIFFYFMAIKIRGIIVFVICLTDVNILSVAPVAWLL